MEQIVRQFILDNPSVLIESIERMQQRKIEEMNAQVNDLIKSRKAELEGEKMSPTIGEGNIPVIMFYDANCTYCKKASLALDQLMDANKDLKVIYKPLPILGESSEYATKIELAVYKLFPDKFKAVHTALMSQKISSREDIVLILDKNSIPITAVEAEFDSPDMKAYIKSSAGLAADLKMQGVPNFIIGDTLYQGFLELSRMQAIVADVRSKMPVAPAPVAAPTAPAVAPEAAPAVVAPAPAKEDPKVAPVIIAPAPAPASNDKKAE